MNSDALSARIENLLGSSSSGSAEHPPSKPPPPIPDHALIARIGGGSYGDVWLAKSITGARRAVKIVWRSRFSNERPYEREFHGIVQFEPISRSHPGVINVLHVGRDDAAGCFYYVMELADAAEPRVEAKSELRVEKPSREGPTQPQLSAQTPLNYSPRSLASELRAHGRMPVPDAVALGVQLANALGHLHRHGLVHRDVKPSNVIFVDGLAKLADIGLVTGMDEARSFVGTEGFIPPEGPGAAQADIFSLGRLLYEAATGKDRCEFPMLPADLDQWPQPEREAMLELNEVLARACAAKPKNRHANAAELASDLNVILAGRSVRRRYGIERRLRTATRVSFATVAVLAVSAGVVWFQETQRRESEIRATHEESLRRRAETAEHEQSLLRDEAQEAQASEAQARRRAEAQELAARKKAYASDMKLLQLALAADELGRAQELLDRQRPQPGEQDLRGWEWRYLWQFCQSDAAFTLCQRTNSISSVSFSSDGTLLAIGGAYPYEVSVWNLANRHMLPRLGRFGNAPAKLSFAPHGNTLAFYTAFNTGSNLQQTIVLWDGRTPMRRLPVKAQIRDLAFTRDGRLFAADLSTSNNVTVWDIEKGDLLTNFTARVPPYLNGTVFAITADGERFAHAAGSLGFVEIMDANGGRDPSFRVADEYITALAFSPDGQTLVTGGGFLESTIKLWDVPTRKFLGSLEGHRSWLGCLKFLPDGKTLASASGDRTIRLWNFETRQMIRTLRGQGGEVWAIDISPDGRWLASGGEDGAVMLWDLTSSTNRPPEYRTLPVRQRIANPTARSWDYSPNGRLLAAIDEGRLKLYNAGTLELFSEPPLTLTNITGFTFSPDMRLLLVTDAQGGLGVWDMQEHRMVTNFVAHSSAATLAPGFVSDGKSALTHGAGVFKEWDVATWQQIRQFSALTGLFYRASSPAANLVATASGSGSFEIIPIHDPDNRRRFRGQTRTESVNLSPDGKTLGAASGNGSVEIWDTETLTRRALLRGVVLGYHSVAFSPDGQRLAAGSNGKDAVKMWDFDSYEDVATLAGQGSIFGTAGFSPDGNTVAARNAKGVLHLWTAPTWAEIEAAEKAPATVSPNSNIPSLPR